MARRRTTSVLGLAILAGLAVTGCTAPSAEQPPTPTRSPSSSATPAPTPTDTPTDTPTTAAPAGWTDDELTTVCADFQAGEAADGGYLADDFEWTSPASTQQDGGIWYVFLQGTFTTPEGDPVPAEFTCAVSGPPDAPVVKEAASG